MTYEEAATFRNQLRVIVSYVDDAMKDVEAASERIREMLQAFDKRVELEPKNELQKTYSWVKS